jgi:phosphatidylinositol alpha-mannosyltransferase
MPLAASLIIRFLDQAISVSSSQVKYIRIFQNNKIKVISNGIDLPKITTTRQYDINKPVLLFIGRLEPRKGVMHALGAFRNIKKKIPNLKMIIAGDGDEMNISKEYIKVNQLKDIELYGFVSEETKQELLNSCDIFLAPSLYGESFGIVLLEAMSAGMPITGYANEGYLTVLNNFQKTYFAPPGDLQELVGKIEKLINIKSEIRQTLIESGKKNAAKYDWKKVAIQISNIYSNALKKKES